MPFITVETWEGRSVDEKRRLVEANKAAMVEHFDCKRENTFVIIHDIPQGELGTCGTAQDRRTTRPRRRILPFGEPHAADSPLHCPRVH